MRALKIAIGHVDQLSHPVAPKHHVDLLLSRELLGRAAAVRLRRLSPLSLCRARRKKAARERVSTQHAVLESGGGSGSGTNPLSSTRATHTQSSPDRSRRIGTLHVCIEGRTLSCARSAACCDSFANARIPSAHLRRRAALGFRWAPKLARRPKRNDWVRIRARRHIRKRRRHARWPCRVHRLSIRASGAQGDTIRATVAYSLVSCSSATIDRNALCSSASICRVVYLPVRLLQTSPHRHTCAPPQARHLLR